MLGSLLPFQVSHQILNCWEIRYVDVGMRWSYCAHVSSGEHHWDDVLIQHHEELLSDVVLTHGVLKGEVEMVFFSKKVEAVDFLLLRAKEVSTVAVDVDWGEKVNHVDEVLPTHCGLTVGHILGDPQPLAAFLPSHLLVVSTKLADVFLKLVTRWRLTSLSSFKLSVRSRDVGILPIGHRQVEKARDLVQLVNSVTKPSLSVGGCLKGEEHIELFGTPVQIKCHTEVNILVTTWQWEGLPNQS